MTKRQSAVLLAAVFVVGVGGGAALVSLGSRGLPREETPPADLPAPPASASPPLREDIRKPSPPEPVAERAREETLGAARDVAPRLLERIMELNAVQEPELDRDALRAAFRRIVESARAATAKAATPRVKIAALNRVLLADRQVTYLSNKYWRDATLAATVLRHRGNCLSTSTLYVLVGQELGLPIRLVIVPGHAFVRWDDGAARINIETTAGGVEVPDEQYFLTRPCTPRDREKLGWGKSKDADGFLCEILLTAARHRHGENRLDEAMALLNEAIALKADRLDIKLWRAQVRADMTADRLQFRREIAEMLRDDSAPPGVVTDALLLLADDCGATGDHEEERRMLVQAFASAPKYQEQQVLERLAFCHRSLKDFRGAVRYMELALAFTPDPRDPRRPSLLYNLAILQKNDSRLKDALMSIDEARRYNPEQWSLKILKAGYLVLAGHRDAGLSLFGGIKDEKPRGQDEFYNNMIAWFYAVSRQRAEFYRAFRYGLAQASSTRVLHWIDQDVDLDVYRHEPEFQALVAKHRARLLGDPQPAPQPNADRTAAPVGDEATTVPAGP